jgi:chemotaxis protein histidine kinase CheA
MSEAPVATKLLHRVGRRLRLLQVSHAFYVSFVVGCLVYLTALLASRGTGWGTAYFTWTTPSDQTPWLVVALVPITAALIALFMARRPRLQDAARAVDESVGARDLYLTLSLLKSAAGEYQPLVVQAAESRANHIEPHRVVPWVWRRRHWHAVWLPALLALGITFLPQLDPFGNVAASTLASQRAQRLTESRRETQLRVAEVRKEAEELAEEGETDKALDKLQLAFNKMQPQQKKLNFEMLSDEQKRLGQEWKKVANEQLQNLLKTAQQAQQQFGSPQQEQLQKWTKDLQAGSADGVKKELDELKQELQKLAKTEDPIEKERAKQELKKRLDNLRKFAQDQAENKELAAAVQRAMSQLDLASLDELSSEAMEGAMESLELAEMELEQLEQAAKDLKKLDEALKALQMAKRLNDRDKLDGKDCQSCKSMSDYAKLYKELLAQCEGQCQGAGKCPGCGQCSGKGKKGGRGDGSGMGGAGTGEGNIAPEDDSISTTFETELAKSAVTAGKVLMSMKSKGPGERGQANIDFQNLIQQVQQGAAEALLQEQVPPGYHDGIKSYFDALEPAPANPAAESNTPNPAPAAATP